MARSITVLAILIVLLVGGIAAALFAMSAHSSLAFDPPPAAIGAATPVIVRIANPHGVRTITARIEQGGNSAIVDETARPATRFAFWRIHAKPEQFHFTAGKDRAPQLKEGKARLVVEARSNDLRAVTDSIATDVDVILHPPSVTTDGFQHYINQGGSELAIFTPSGSWQEAGTRVGPATFRSFPAPGDNQQRLSLFAYSWDTPPETAPVVFAGNSAGTEATARFWFKVFPKKFRARELPIDDAFLEKVDNQIDPGGSGDLLTRFLKINGETRRANNKTLSDLRLKTAGRFLWKQSFLQLANSQVESAFADLRTYVYKGKKVDQLHLGFDLATTQHGPVLAANDGKVIWAAPLGIYGNCIVLDHGYGLQSIYGHLSEIAVKEGDTVERGQPMGKSGSTGLAGGDHLHFSMQVDGVQVNPVEWWDDHWINDHIRSRLKTQ
ncbi:MAG: peptidase [Bryobacterales bacterium]|nr:peptidase [Bryobacterales bacterium]